MQITSKMLILSRIVGLFLLLGFPTSLAFSADPCRWFAVLGSKRKIIETAEPPKMPFHKISEGQRKQFNRYGRYQRLTSYFEMKKETKIPYVLVKPEEIELTPFLTNYPYASEKLQSLAVYEDRTIKTASGPKTERVIVAYKYPLHESISAEGKRNLVFRDRPIAGYISAAPSASRTGNAKIRGENGNFFLGLKRPTDRIVDSDSISPNKLITDSKDAQMISSYIWTNRAQIPQDSLLQFQYEIGSISPKGNTSEAVIFRDLGSLFENPNLVAIPGFSVPLVAKDTLGIQGEELLSFLLDEVHPSIGKAYADLSTSFGIRTHGPSLHSQNYTVLLNPKAPKGKRVVGISILDMPDLTIIDEPMILRSHELTRSIKSNKDFKIGARSHFYGTFGGDMTIDSSFAKALGMETGTWYAGAIAKIPMQFGYVERVLESTYVEMLSRLGKSDSAAMSRLLERYLKQKALLSQFRSQGNELMIEPKGVLQFESIVGSELKELEKTIDSLHTSAYNGRPPISPSPHQSVYGLSQSQTTEIFHKIAAIFANDAKEFFTELKSEKEIENFILNLNVINYSQVTKLDKEGLQTLKKELAKTVSAKSIKPAEEWSVFLNPK